MAVSREVRKRAEGDMVFLGQEHDYRSGRAFPIASSSANAVKFTLPKSQTVTATRPERRQGGPGLCYFGRATVLGPACGTR